MVCTCHIIMSPEHLQVSAFTYNPHAKRDGEAYKIADARTGLLAHP